MRILVIGGTRFVGYHIVREAIERGHEVTLFNRGVTGAGLFPQLRQVRGDRREDLGRLDSMEFDAVIDTCCYQPGHMRAAAEYFAHRAPWYLLVSTVSVCDVAKPGAEESDLLPACVLDGPPEEMWANYGAYKAGCEVIARETFGDRLTILRPGFVCGERDATDRMTYWPVKMHFNREIIRPAGDSDFQLVDARDLAAFALHTVENQIAGVFHVLGPERPLLFSDFLAICRQVANPDCFIIPLSEEALGGCGLTRPALPEAFPLWLVGAEGVEGIYQVSNRKALAHGLKLRPVEETVRAALDSFLARGTGEDGLACGLPAKREREIIEGLSEAFRLRGE